MGIKGSNGEIVIPAVYDHIDVDGDEWFTAEKGNEKVYLDTRGRVMLRPDGSFDEYGQFNEGLGWVRKDGLCGFIGKDGKQRIPCQYYFARGFSDGMSIVRNEKGLHGVINSSGKLEIPYRYGFISDFNNGYAVFGATLKGIVNRTGVEVAAPEFYIIKNIDKAGTATVVAQTGNDLHEGLLTIGKGVKWNDRMDARNQYYRKVTAFEAAAEHYLNSFNAGECPCEFDRFRRFIEWKSPVSFVDQEKLWQQFVLKLEKLNNEHYSCKNCGTIYKASVEQFSISPFVLNVELVSRGNKEERGASSAGKTPFALNFVGYDFQKYIADYVHADIETVFAYLRKPLSDNSKADAFEIVKPNESFPGKLNWWKRLFGHR